MLSHQLHQLRRAPIAPTRACPEPVEACPAPVEAVPSNVEEREIFTCPVTPAPRAGNGGP